MCRKSDFFPFSCTLLLGFRWEVYCSALECSRCRNNFVLLNIHLKQKILFVHIWKPLPWLLKTHSEYWISQKEAFFWHTPVRISCPLIVRSYLRSKILQAKNPSSETRCEIAVESNAGDVQMNTSVLCIYKHGFSLLVWVTDSDMRQLIWVWVWQERIVRLGFCVFVCFCQILCIFTPMWMFVSAYVCTHAFIFKRRWAKKKGIFLEVHRKTKTHSWSLALVHVKLKEIIKSLLFPSFSHLPLFSLQLPLPISEPFSPSLPSSLLILMEEETWSFHDSAADTMPPAMMSIRQTVLLLSLYYTDITRKKGVIIKCGRYFKLCGSAHFSDCLIPLWK